MNALRIAKAVTLWMLFLIYLFVGAGLLVVVLTNPIRMPDTLSGLAVAGGFVVSAVTLFSERRRLRLKMITFLMIPAAILWIWIENIHEL